MRSETPPVRKSVRHEPVEQDHKGNSDMVVMVTLRKASGKRINRFVFEERLGLSIHARLPSGMTEGGYAVPPAMYQGTVEKISTGTCIAKVKMAISRVLT